MGGVAIFVLVVLVGLHLILPKWPKVRIILCICLGVGLCFTGTLHGVSFAIMLVFGEIIVNKIIGFMSKTSTDDDEYFIKS